MDNHGAVIGARRFAHPAFKHVQNDVEPQIAVDVNVQLIPRVPEKLRALVEIIRRHQPFAVVPVQIPVFHLHELRNNRAVGEKFDLFREKGHFSLRRQRHLLFRGGQRFGKPQPRIELRARIHDEIAVERRFRRAQKLLVKESRCPA